MNILQRDEIPAHRRFLGGKSRPADYFSSKFQGLDHAEWVSTGFMVASGEILSEGYGHGRPGVCLGDGHTEA